MCLLLIGGAPANSQVRLNAQVTEWKRVHDTQGWSAFLQRVKADLFPPEQERSLAQMRGAPVVNSWVHSLPPAAGRVNDEFWARLSQMREPNARAGGGGGGLRSGTSGLAPADFRGSHLFAPYAAEWLGSFTVEPPSTSGYNVYNSIPSRADALRAFEVHAAFMARQGVNVVRVLFPYGAYKWWTLSGNGGGGSGATNYAAFLEGVVAALDRHGIKVIVALGNTWGEDPIQPQASQHPFQRVWKQSDGANIPRFIDPATQQLVASRYLTYDEAPWTHTGYFQEPSNRAATDGDTDSTFLQGQFYPYITWLADKLKTHTNIIGWELFNEPEGVPFDKIAGTIEGILAAVQAAGADGGRAIVLGARSPTLMTLLDSYFSSGSGWITSNVQWVGFHVQTVPFHRGVLYQPSGKDGNAGFPPRPSADGALFGLLDPTDPPARPGALSEIYDFMNSFSVQGFIEEAFFRGFYPQLVHDLDLAAREGGSPTGDQQLGFLCWNSAYTSRAPWILSANGGGDFIPREALSLQDRNRVGTESSGESDVASGFAPIDNATSGNPDSRVFRIPTASNPTSEPGSRAMRPLILTGGNGPTTLVVSADPFEDLPMVAHYADPKLDPANSVRPNARNRIWVRAFRSTARSSMQDLYSLSSSNELCRLTWDLRFKEVSTDHLGSGENPSALRFRRSILDVHTLGAWIRSFDQNGGTPIHYPSGPIAIDPVWSFVESTGSGTTVKTPTVLLPATDCSGWTDYQANLGSLEFEMTLRKSFHLRSRLSYVGVSGQVAGVALNPTSTHDRFLLAYHRTVPSTLQSEHYGAAQDAASSTSDLKLRESARYGDLFRRTTSQSQTVAEKYEIVLVEIGVQYSSGAFSFSVSPSVLPTLGDHNVSGATEGASALDPRLARNDAGDVAILYRKIQDPWFYFDQSKDSDASSVTIQLTPGLDGTGACNPTTNPLISMLPAASGAQPRVKFTTTWTQSAMSFYPAVLAVRFRAAETSAFGAETLVSEPYKDPGSGGLTTENWQYFQDRCKNQRETDATNFLFLDSAVPQFGRWLTDRPSSGGLDHVEIDENDPQTWHPAWPAALHVGPRVPPSGGEGESGPPRVLVAWKQIPRQRRKVEPWYVISSAPREKPAYAVYAVSPYADFATNTINAPTTFERFQSAFGMLDPANGDQELEHDPMLTTWGPPAVTFDYVASSGGNPVEADTADLRATWQQRWHLHNQKATQTGSGRPTAVDQPGTSDKAILLDPKSGYEPRRGLFSPDSTLRLTAWCHPSGSATEIRYEWQMAVAGSSSGATPLTMPGESGNFSSTALTRMVAVVPWVRNLSNGVPVGRVVWQADDDIWVAEVPYSTTSGYEPKVARVTPNNQRVSGKGKFPVLWTEVSVAGDKLAWTYDGKVHAVRMTGLSFP